jgi:hypothetical protein
MGDENLQRLSRAELRASLAHHAAREGLDCEERPAPDGGLHVALASANGGGETYFAVSPAGADWVSLSLVLVVDRAFFLGNTQRILDVTSRFEICVAMSGDESLPDGEAYLNLSLRIFRDGWNGRVFGRALRTLSAAKDGLAREFP